MFPIHFSPSSFLVLPLNVHAPALPQKSQPTCAPADKSSAVFHSGKGASALFGTGPSYTDVVSETEGGEDGDEEGGKKKKKSGGDKEKVMGLDCRSRSRMGSETERSMFLDKALLPLMYLSLDMRGVISTVSARVCPTRRVVENEITSQTAQLVHCYCCVHPLQTFCCTKQQHLLRSDISTNS